MKKLTFLLALLLLSSFSYLQAQQIIDTNSSGIKFHITGGGIFKVKGTFKGMQGDFSFNANNLDASRFNICIDAATINTKNKKRDAHLKNPDFFEVETYPNICFESTSISQNSNGFVTNGKLTIHGVTKDVAIPFTFKNNTFTGTFTLNRFDYNIGQDFGTMRVGKEATITITCVVQ